MSEDKDYLLQIKIKNAPMLRAMRRKGCQTAADLARLINKDATEVGRFLNLKVGAFMKNGEFYPTVLKISEVLNCMPSDLFPPQHYECPLEKNTAEMEVSLDEMTDYFLDGPATPEQLLIESNVKKKIDDALSDLTPRQRLIIDARMSGESLHQIAEKISISVERVRQIEGKLLYRLQKPLLGAARQIGLKAELNTDGIYSRYWGNQ